MGATKAYRVMLNGKEIDTVFYSTGTDTDDVRRSLIEHDGYDASIEVEVQMTFQEAAEKLQITFSVLKVPQRVDRVNDEWDKTASHYLCTIGRAGFGPWPRHSFFYSMGSAHTKGPSVSEVLQCLTSDARMDLSSFENWCSDMGMDEDSRKAERLYNECLEHSKRFISWAGDMWDTLKECEEA